MEIKTYPFNGFLCMSDLMKEGNQYRALNKLPIVVSSQYFRKQTVRNFVFFLEDKYGEVEIVRNKNTWLHPLLAMDMLLWLKPDDCDEVIDWYVENLFKYENLGKKDNLASLVGAIYANNSYNKGNFTKIIKTVDEKIHKACKGKKEDIKMVYRYCVCACNMISDLDLAIDVGIKRYLCYNTK